MQCADIARLYQWVATGGRERPVPFIGGPWVGKVWAQEKGGVFQRTMQRLLARQWRQRTSSRVVPMDVDTALLPEGDVYGAVMVEGMSESGRQGRDLMREVDIDAAVRVGRRYHDAVCTDVALSPGTVAYVRPD